MSSIDKSMFCCSCSGLISIPSISPQRRSRICVNKSGLPRPVLCEKVTYAGNRRSATAAAKTTRSGAAIRLSSDFSDSSLNLRIPIGLAGEETQVLSEVCPRSFERKVLVCNHLSKLLRSKRHAMSASGFEVALPHAPELLRRISVHANSGFNRLVPLSSTARNSLQLGGHGNQDILLFLRKLPDRLQDIELK